MLLLLFFVRMGEGEELEMEYRDFQKEIARAAPAAMAMAKCYYWSGAGRPPFG